MTPFLYILKKNNLKNIQYRDFNLKTKFDSRLIWCQTRLRAVYWKFCSPQLLIFFISHMLFRWAAWGFPSACLLTAVYLGIAAEWHVVNNTCAHRRLRVNLPQPERPVTSTKVIAWKICIVRLGKMFCEWYYCSSSDANWKM